MMIYILFFSLTMSATEFSPAVSQYIQKLGVSKPLIGLQYVGAFNQTSNPKNVFFDKTRWQEFNREEKEIIIDYLIVKNAEQKISPFKSLYLKIFKIIFSRAAKKTLTDDSIFFGAFYNDSTIYKNPQGANIRVAHYKFDAYEPQNGMYALPFQVKNHETWEILSVLQVKDNILTLNADSESYSIQLPTKNIYSIHFLDGRLSKWNRDDITTEAECAKPIGVLITLKNGMQLIWQLPKTERVDLDLLEDNDPNASIIISDPAFSIIPVNFERIEKPSYNYALHLHKQLHVLQGRFQFLARFNFRSMIGVNSLSYLIHAIRHAI